MLQLAEEMVDEERQRVDVPAPAGTVNGGLAQKRLDEDFC